MDTYNEMSYPDVSTLGLRVRCSSIRQPLHSSVLQMYGASECLEIPKRVLEDLPAAVTMQHVTDGVPFQAIERLQKQHLHPP